MWKPIINSTKEKDLISNRIDEIYVTLIKRINKLKEFDLYMGKAGICLFFVYYQIIHKRSENNIEHIVNSLLESLCEYKITEYKDLTIYSEIGWFLCHLYERKQINIDTNDYFSDIDESLYESMILLLNKEEYGFINGATSIGLYFYYRYRLGSGKCKKYLESFIDLLKKTSIEENNTIKWISIIDYGTYEKGYNLGIAHGLPGILLFLRKLYLADVKKDIVSDIIIKTTNFLLLQKHSLNNHKSFFYDTCSQFTDLGRDTRLGWCYGDMSIAYSLFNISSLKGIERQDVKENALDILVNTTYRTNLKDIGIVDAGICHGTVSVAHIYNKLYHQTKDSVFRDAALYWYRKTMKMAEYENNYAGYRVPYYLDENEKELCELHNLSFLTGIAGIGTALLSAIYPIEPSWDECLLLS